MVSMSEFLSGKAEIMNPGFAAGFAAEASQGQIADLRG